MNKAIFLDRDGVINFERGYTHLLTDFKILPDVFEALKKFQEHHYLLVIVTNQSGIGKGLYTANHVETIHQFMMSEFVKNNITISEIYYCVHHPDSGNCLCRKPSSLFVEKALARFNINPSQSYFIGDKERDVIAGEGAGVKGILIEANSSLKLIEKQIV